MKHHPEIGLLSGDKSRVSLNGQHLPSLVFSLPGRISVSCPIYLVCHQPNPPYRDLSSALPGVASLLKARDAWKHGLSRCLCIRPPSSFGCAPWSTCVFMCTGLASVPEIQWASLFCLRTGWYLRLHNMTEGEELFHTNMLGDVLGLKDWI